MGLVANESDNGRKWGKKFMVQKDVKNFKGIGQTNFASLNKRIDT